MFLLVFKISFLLGMAVRRIVSLTRLGVGQLVQYLSKKKTTPHIDMIGIKTKRPRLDMPFYRNSKCKL